MSANLGIFVVTVFKMKTKVLIVLFVLSFGLILAQKPVSEKQFPIKIEGDIKNFTGTKIYLHHRINEKDFTDSAKVVKGKFNFNLKSTEPNMYWFTTNRELTSQPNFIFFADEAPIRAYLKGDSIVYSSIEAGQAQRDYMEYRALINSFVMIQQRMQTDYNTAVQNNDVNTQSAIRNEYQNLNSQYLNGLKNFVKSHSKSVVSGHIVYSDLNNPNIPVSELVETLSYIDKSIENTHFVKAMYKKVNEIKGSQIGYTANDFAQTTPDGKRVSLSDLRGKYVLLDFWASWCRPCRMENPNVVSAYNRFKDKGFTVLGVSLDQNKEAWINAIKQDGLTWTHISDLKGWANEAGKLYNVTGIPQNFLIDKDGKIIAKDLRGAALDEKLAEIIK